MSPNKYDDTLMIRYLLGEVSEEEQTGIEEQFLADDDCYQELLALENELRYEYAQGGLTPAQRTSFEKRVLKTAEDRKKADLAKAILNAMKEMAAPVEPVGAESKTLWQSLAGLFIPRGGWRLSYAAAAAVGAVAVVGGPWFAFQTIHLRDQVARLEAERSQRDAVARQEMSSAQMRQDQLARQLDQERARREELEHRSGMPLRLSFILTPGLARDTEGVKRLVIPPGASEALFDLSAGAKGFVSFRVELLTVDGDVLWSQNVSRAAVAVPARILKGGDYVVELKGTRANGETGDAGQFYFHVVKP